MDDTINKLKEVYEEYLEALEQGRVKDSDMLNKIITMIAIAIAIDTGKED